MMISTHLRRVLTARKSIHAWERLRDPATRDELILQPDCQMTEPAYNINSGGIQMKLVPLGDRVVLKALEAETTTASGIVIPGKEKEKPQQAEVIAVGPGGMVDGKEVKMEVAVGDQVIYSKYAGTSVKLDDDTEYTIVRQNDILAIIK